MSPEAYAALFHPGAKCMVNGSGDLMVDRSQGYFIGKTVEVVKRCKSGLILIREPESGKQASLPQRNLDPL